MPLILSPSTVPVKVSFISPSCRPSEKLIFLPSTLPATAPDPNISNSHVPEIFVPSCVTFSVPGTFPCGVATDICHVPASRAGLSCAFRHSPLNPKIKTDVSSVFTVSSS